MNDQKNMYQRTKPEKWRRIIYKSRFQKWAFEMRKGVKTFLLKETHSVRQSDLDYMYNNPESY